MHGKTLTAIIILVIVVLGAWWIFTSGLLIRSPAGALDTQTAPTPESAVTFMCADAKIIEAGFSDRMVTLTLSDGRAVTLEQTVSASGARYANDGDQMVFWNKGTTAFIEENGEMSYMECVLEGSDAPIEID